MIDLVPTERTALKTIITLADFGPQNIALRPGTFEPLRCHVIMLLVENVPYYVLYNIFPCRVSGSPTSIFGGYDSLWVPKGAKLIPGEIKPDENIDFHDIYTFHRNIIFRVGQMMSTSSSCAFPKLELTTSYSSAPLRYIEGGGNSHYQTLSPLILFH